MDSDKNTNSLFISYKDFINLIHADDSVILFTNDTHGCTVHGRNSLGFDSLFNVKKKILNITNKVLLVDIGDTYQGTYICRQSNGNFVPKIMNRIGYDIFVPGNHDFIFGIDKIIKFSDIYNYKTVCCNFPSLPKINKHISKPDSIKPYFIKRDIGFVGVTTLQEKTNTSKLSIFRRLKWVITNRKGTKYLFRAVQKNVDKCLSSNAKKVILLAHMDLDCSSTNCTNLAKQIKGLDAILCGHSHRNINIYIPSEHGSYIPMCSSGSMFEHIGALLIKSDGSISTHIINKVESYDCKIYNYINNLKTEIDLSFNKIVASSDCYLPFLGDGSMKSSSREDSLGNLITDAFKFGTNSQFAITPATSYRNCLPAGDITKEDIYNILPFKDNIICVKISGKSIIDLFEYAYQKTSIIYKNEHNQPIGSFPHFLQVSGICLTINTSIKYSQKFNFLTKNIKYCGQHRTSNIKILQNGHYKKINCDEMYVCSAPEYFINIISRYFPSKVHKTKSSHTEAGQCLIQYISSLNGKLASKYSNTQNRIKVL